MGTVNHIRSAPERGLPFWVGPSEPCIKTGAWWAEPKWGTSSLVFILYYNNHYNNLSNVANLTEPTDHSNSRIGLVLAEFELAPRRGEKWRIV